MRLFCSVSSQISMLFLFVFATFAAGCTASPNANPDIGLEQSGQTQANLDRKLSNLAAQAVTENSLTEIPIECLSFSLSDALYNGHRIVDIRERHSEQCGGDPHTAPRLFSIAIDEVDGALWSDANSLTGQFEQIE